MTVNHFILIIRNSRIGNACYLLGYIFTFSCTWHSYFTKKCVNLITKWKSIDMKVCITFIRTLFRLLSQQTETLHFTHILMPHARAHTQTFSNAQIKKQSQLLWVENKTKIQFSQNKLRRFYQILLNYRLSGRKQNITYWTPFHQTPIRKWTVKKRKWTKRSPLKKKKNLISQNWYKRFRSNLMTFENV